VTYLGEKGYSDGMAMANNNILYFGSNADSGVYFWNISASPNVVKSEVLAENSLTMQWIDTFGFDNAEGLIYTSNKLPKWIFGGMQFDGSDGANFRIWNVPINASSYLTGKPIPPSLPCRIAS
jgi:hypothetical protein